MTNQVCSQGPLRNARVLLALPGCASLASLAAQLSALGAQCEVLNQAADFANLNSIEQAFNAAATRLGGVDALVLAVGAEENLSSQAFTQMSPAQWQTACLAPLRLTRQCLQAAARQLADGGLSIALLGPNLSLTGAAGLAALSTLSEGQRGLMKSSARQLGGQGVRINWLGLDSRMFAAQLAHANIPQSPEMGPPPPALGAVPGLDGVAQALSMVLSGAPVTGASIPVDGGLWMVP